MKEDSGKTVFIILFRGDKSIPFAAGSNGAYNCAVLAWQSSSSNNS
jgi:hypothetical protein